MMKAAHALALVPSLAFAAFAACNGDNGSPDGGGLDATGDTVQNDVVTQDVIQDAGVLDVNEAGPILDACVAIEGGLACDPAHIQCGPTLSCTAGAQFCCIQNEAGAFTCDVDAAQCMTGMGMMGVVGTKMYCDEAANCPNGELCCGFVGGAGEATRRRASPRAAATRSSSATATPSAAATDRASGRHATASSSRRAAACSSARSSRRSEAANRRGGIEADRGSRGARVA